METLGRVLGGPGDLVSKAISRVIIGVTPFRVLITLLITYLLGPLPLQVSIPPNSRTNFNSLKPTYTASSAQALKP